jgi:hypothetical protein
LTAEYDIDARQETLVISTIGTTIANDVQDPTKAPISTSTLTYSIIYTDIFCYLGRFGRSDHISDPSRRAAGRSSHREMFAITTPLFAGYLARHRTRLEMS